MKAVELRNNPLTVRDLQYAVEKIFESGESTAEVTEQVAKMAYARKLHFPDFSLIDAVSDFARQNNWSVKFDRPHLWFVFKKL